MLGHFFGFRLTRNYHQIYPTFPDLTQIQKISTLPFQTRLSPAFRKPQNQKWF